MRKLALAFVISLAAGTAAAAPVTWTSSGVIVDAFQSDQLPLNAQAGDAFTYAVVYDDATADAAPGMPGFGNYLGAILSATFSIGGDSFDIPFISPNELVILDYPADPYRQISF